MHNTKANIKLQSVISRKGAKERYESSDKMDPDCRNTVLRGGVPVCSTRFLLTEPLVPWNVQGTFQDWLHFYHCPLFLLSFGGGGVG